MSTPEKVLSDFIDAWNAGRRPRVHEYLEQVPSGPQRDELADQLSAWLEIAPTPAYSADARAAIRAEPVVQEVLATVGEDAGLWPVLLPRLRARAGLGVREVAAALLDRLGVGSANEERAADYLQRMERGQLRPEGVSRRLLDALGDLLGVSGSSLADAGAGGALRPAAAGGTLFRADEDAGRWLAEDIEVLSQAAMAPAPAPMDELDRLFCGGPDA